MDAFLCLSSWTRWFALTMCCKQAYIAYISIPLITKTIVCTQNWLSKSRRCDHVFAFHRDRGGLRLKFVPGKDMTSSFLCLSSWRKWFAFKIACQKAYDAIISSPFIMKKMVCVQNWLSSKESLVGKVFLQRSAHLDLFGLFCGLMRKWKVPSSIC